MSPPAQCRSLRRARPPPPPRLRPRPLRAPPRTARASSADDAGVREAAAIVRRGGLVAFPTETVWGLGARRSTPRTRRRDLRRQGPPVLDPLIARAAELDDALALYDDGRRGGGGRAARARARARAVIAHLGRAFWPGPPRSSATPRPPCRAPSPPARAASACACPRTRSRARCSSRARAPICAPSANKPGHVSPARAEHVVADLGGEDIAVLGARRRRRRRGRRRRAADAAAGAGARALMAGECRVGVESSVVRVRADEADEADERGERGGRERRARALPPRRGLGARCATRSRPAASRGGA